MDDAQEEHYQEETLHDEVLCAEVLMEDVRQEVTPTAPLLHQNEEPPSHLLNHQARPARGE